MLIAAFLIVVDIAERVLCCFLHCSLYLAEPFNQFFCRVLAHTAHGGIYGHFPSVVDNLEVGNFEQTLHP